jgi:hypothetical protein
MVCITLAFWLGRGKRTGGGCWANTKGAAHAIAKRAARLKRESRFREFIVALLIEEFRALCNALLHVSKGLGIFGVKNLQLFTIHLGQPRLCRSLILPVP